MANASAKKTHLTFFLPEGRVLSDAEVRGLPDDKRSAAENAGQEGVWMEIPCPGGSCVEGEGKITIEAAVLDAPPDRREWLNIICPEDRSLFKTGTELP